MEFIRFFQSGGPFMYAILAIMALGLAITVDRFLYLNRTQKKAHRVWEKVSPMLRAEDYSRAAHALTEMTGPLAKILSYGFSRLQTNARRESIESAMEEGVMEVGPEVEQRTHYLGLLAKVGILLGRLGTIIGLIQDLTAVAAAKASEKAQLLTASMSVAMNSTTFGLCTTITLLLLHSN